MTASSQSKETAYRKRRKRRDTSVFEGSSDTSTLSVSGSGSSLSPCEDSSSPVVPSVHESTDDDTTPSLVSLATEGTTGGDESVQGDKEVPVPHSLSTSELQVHMSQGSLSRRPKDWSDLIQDSSSLAAGALASKLVETSEPHTTNSAGTLLSHVLTDLCASSSESHLYFSVSLKTALLL